MKKSRLLADEVRRRARIARHIFVGHSSQPSAFLQEETLVKLGHYVSHPSFGEGMVIGAEGSSARAQLQTNFEGAGSMWLVASYANLTPL